MADDYFAPGIPASRAVQRLPTVTRPAHWDLTVHDHAAQRAGRHFDLRLLDPATGHAHSWALRHWPQRPGEVRLAVQQPTHTREYMTFTGVIEDGYGRGHVSIARREKAEVLSADDRHVRFNVYPGQGVEEYLLRRTDGNKWIIRNVTPTRQSRDVPSDKPGYREKDVARIDVGDRQSLLQAKIDGAHVLYDFSGSRPQVYSYRAGKKRDLIIHTPRVPGLMAAGKTPRELRGALLRGELTAVDRKSGRALPAARVGGLLNAGVWRSREQQRQQGAPVVPYVFDVQRWRGRDVSDRPYDERRQFLDAARRALPVLKAPRTAETPAAKTRLIADIASGREKSTDEGVVEWKRRVTGPPAKAKMSVEHDVYVRRVFPEESKRQLAGGFEYSLGPRGPVVGRVGTGFSHGMKAHMIANPGAYEGLRARVTAAPAPAHYALRAPVFKSWHLDQELPEGVKTAALSAGGGECAEGGGRSLRLGPRSAAALARLKAAMRPGDIINTDPRRTEGFGAVYKPLSALVQGTRFGHSAVYEGGDSVIEARMGRGVVRRQLADLARCNDLRVLRVEGAGEKERGAALSYLRSQLGREFSIMSMIRGGLKPTVLSSGEKGSRQRRAMDALFCSNVIANAYHCRRFNPDRGISDTRPVDILRSHVTRVIGELRHGDKGKTGD